MAERINRKRKRMQILCAKFCLGKSIVYGFSILLESLPEDGLLEKVLLWFGVFVSLYVFGYLGIWT